MRSYPLSLYYRLFFVFGATFVLVVLVLSFTIRRAMPTQRYAEIERIAKDSIIQTLGPNPSKADIEAIERRYSIDVNRAEGSIELAADFMTSEPETRFQIITAGFVVALSLILLNSLWVRRILAPIEDVAKVAREFSDGKMDVRVPENSNDEIGELSKSFNHMADQIQRQIESLKHMAIGISHEIRSPLARMRVAIEKIKEPTVFELIRSQLAEIDEVTGVVLEREALSSGISELKSESIDINDLVEQLASYYRRFGRNVGAEVSENATLFGDRRRLEMWFKNVLDNAFKYGASESVTIRVHTAGTETVVAIANDTNAESTAQTRDDLRPIEGSGLGLLLCESIAKAHGGRQEIDRSEKTFVARLHLPTAAT